LVAPPTAPPKPEADKLFDETSNAVYPVAPKSTKPDLVKPSPPSSARTKRKSPSKQVIVFLAIAAVLVAILLGLGALLIQPWVLNEAYQHFDAKEYTEAVPFLRFASFLGNPRAMSDLGRMYQNDDMGVKKNFSKARQLLQRAADAGDSHAMDNLGYMFQENQGVPKDWVQAESWYLKAIKADSRNDSAMNHLGVLYKSGGPGVPQDYHKARLWFERSAQRGNQQSQHELDGLPP
jgi:TPR repeat protein